MPDVTAGTTIGIAVHGYKGSDYELEVFAPRHGIVVTPSPTVEERMTGVVESGEIDSLAPISIELDGTLDVQLSGSGDADVYVAIGAPPSVESYDWRLYGATSNERGKLPVRKGDVVHVIVHGYGPRSEYDLVVRSI